MKNASIFTHEDSPHVTALALRAGCYLDGPAESVAHMVQRGFADMRPGSVAVINGHMRDAMADMARAGFHWHKHRAAIVARMKSEYAKDLSDPELKRTLGPCVAGRGLIKIAKRGRDLGLFHHADLLTESPEQVARDHAALMNGHYERRAVEYDGLGMKKKAAWARAQKTGATQ